MKWILVCLSVLFLGACSDQRIQDASIERIELEVSAESASVRVTAYGHFTGGCKVLHEVTQRREGDTFFVEITTAEPADLSATLCEPGEPSTEEVILSVEDFPDGTYTVNVNGVTETFTLP